MDNKKVITFFRKKYILCFEGSCPEIYLEKCFTKNKIGPKKRLTNAQKLSKISIMFQVDPTYNDVIMEDICKKINKATVLLKNTYKL